MTAFDLFRFSAGALRGHRLRTVLSLLGVAIGVASVILLTSLGEGARKYVVGEFTSLGSNLLIIIPGKTETSGVTPFISEAPNDLTVEDSEALVRRVPRLRRVAPVAFGTAEVKFGDRTREITVLGSTAPLMPIRNLQLSSGRFLPEGDSGEQTRACVIGAQVQREIFGNRNPLGEILRVGDYRFRVIGVLAAQGTSLGMNLDEVVYIPVGSALRIFNRTSLFRILAEVGAHGEMPAARAEILAVLKERHDNEEDVTVLTQDSVVSTFNKILSMLTAALAGIAAISLSVAGVGIMNVMLVTVVERTREIGLMKALGVTRTQIVRVFLVESAILSMMGGAVGMAIGFAGGAVARRLFPDFPVQAPLWAVVAAVVVSVLVGVVFGALPARRAARLDPVTALARR